MSAAPAIALYRPSPLPQVEARIDLVSAWLLSYGSLNTRDAYRSDLGDWIRWCDAREVAPLAARRVHVDAWARTLEQDYRPTTVARRLASLASFYSYCVGEYVIDFSPLETVRRPRTGEGYVDFTPALDGDELHRLIAAATSHQDRALVLVLAVLGLRVSELLTLDLDRFDMVRGHTTIVVSGKGGRIDRLPLPPLVVAAIDDLAQSEGRTVGPVFLDRNERRWNRHQAGRALIRIGKAARIERRVRPHMLRATAITRALDLGATLRDVQDLARHADPRTTRRYDRSRGALDRSPVFALAGDLANAASRPAQLV
jgi:integrase/recombinase XerD